MDLFTRSEHVRGHGQAFEDKAEPLWGQG